jgi:hypothetical protein
MLRCMRWLEQYAQARLNCLTHLPARHADPSSPPTHAEAEAAYNLGRAAHRIGLLHVAVAHYERVLQLADELEAAAAAAQLSGLQVSGPASIGHQRQQQQHAESPEAAEMEEDAAAAGGQQEQTQQQPEQPPGPLPQQQAELQQLGRGLAREAAHNLALIYKGSGAEQLACAILRRYVTI